MNFIMAAAAVAGGTAAWLLYRHFVQTVQLFELDNPRFVAETLKWLPDHQLAKIHNRGGMTRHQWRKVQSKLMREIDASLGTRNGRGAATAI